MEMEVVLSFLRTCLLVVWWILYVAAIIPVALLALLCLAFLVGLAVEIVVVVNYDWWMGDWSAVPVPTGFQASMVMAHRGRWTEVTVAL